MKIIWKVAHFMFILFTICSIVAGRNDDSVINAALDRKHIETFYDVLHTHMLTMGEMQLGLCTLHKINLPGITIMENRVSLYILK